MPLRNDQLGETLAAPLGDLLSELGRGVAEAQEALDAQAIHNFKRIQTGEEEDLALLRELGYQPTWYQIPEATAEIQISLSASGSQESVRQTKSQPQDSSAMNNRSSRGRSRVKLYATPVDATYTNKYNFELKASSKLTCRIVPIPAPNELDQMRVVPKLVGQDLGVIKRLLDRMEIKYEISSAAASAPSDATITGQEPEAGTMIEEDEVIQIFV